MFAGSIPTMQQNSGDILIPGFQPNPVVVNLLESIVEQYPDLYENGTILEPLKQCMSLKFRDLIADTVAEFNRMENFCRIYPAKNCKLYDKYFSGNKHLTKVMYKVLHTAEVIPYGTNYSGAMRV